MRSIFNIFLVLIFFLTGPLIHGQEPFCEQFTHILNLASERKTELLTGKQRKTAERRATDGSVYREFKYAPASGFDNEYSNPLYKPELKLVENGNRATLDYYFDAGTSGQMAIKVLEEYESRLKNCSMDEWETRRYTDYNFPYIEFLSPDDNDLSVSIILMDNMDFRNPRYMINLQFNFTYDAGKHH
jgi:hypothetical protein